MCQLRAKIHYTDKLHNKSVGGTGSKLLINYYKYHPMKPTAAITWLMTHLSVVFVNETAWLSQHRRFLYFSTKNVVNTYYNEPIAWNSELNSTEEAKELAWCRLGNQFGLKGAGNSNCWLLVHY
jgi:hypothetical protein